ncbi:MAG: serine/threonine protein phosphatase [Ruminococcus sp.]|uniref:serine/threonine protein phosphatase n=1 Tax=Ruminococcus sp. TaxID=41978 RepID=UPI002873BBBF|nr:serine/threonine protein phosphatase [Ruminococcus sp.]MBQ3285339.1 serine/threonine protein phosphatase [Ruminococcus sp.]
MRLFSKRKSPRVPEVQTCTTADRGIIPPLHNLDNPAEFRLYRELREKVPVIDAAIMKLVRLLGEFRIVCADDQAQKAMDEFVSRVPVGGVSTGLYMFICTYFDQLLTCGKAVGEIAVYEDGGIAALYNAPADAVTLCAGDNLVDARMVHSGVGKKEIEHPERICVTLLNPQPGTLRGTSILSGLPFVSDLLMKIFRCVGQNFERAGNVRFAVTYNPPAGAGAVNARQRVKEIAEQWSSAMRDKSRVCDFVSVGDVNIRAIGADSQILDCDVPIRHVLEQIVAKLSVPPFLLGLSWSSTERMSSQQADILTSELEHYRFLLTPVIEKIARAYLNAERLDPRVTVEWSNISLQDETELAAARLDNARAMQLEQSMEVNG